jgi:hypothetical protein
MGQGSDVKKLVFFVALCFLVLLAGCASSFNRVNIIQPGETKEKVISILGEPEDRQFKGNDEAWQYCKTGTGFGMCGYKTIWFYGGRVTGITSYSMACAGFGSCTAHFRQIQWDNAPDRTIEIRER